MSSEPYDPYIPSGQGSQGVSKTAALQDELAEAKDQVNSNLKALAARGERAEAMEQKARELAESGAKFHRSSNKVRRQMWWNETKMRIWLAIGIIVLLAIIIIPAVVATRKS